jgi:hypothetical protein
MRTKDPKKDPAEITQHRQCGSGWEAGPYGILGWHGEISEDGALVEALLLSPSHPGYRASGSCVFFVAQYHCFI